jgi:hypothetical protein
VVEHVAAHEEDLPHKVTAVHEEEQNEVLTRGRRQAGDETAQRRAELPAMLQIVAEREIGRAQAVDQQHAEPQPAHGQQIVDIDRRLAIGHGRS